MKGRITAQGLVRIGAKGLGGRMGVYGFWGAIGCQGLRFQARFRVVEHIKSVRLGQEV